MELIRRGGSEPSIARGHCGDSAEPRFTIDGIPEDGSAGASPSQ